jgi:hypothetical protein
MIFNSSYSSFDEEKFIIMAQLVQSSQFVQLAQLYSALASPAKQSKHPHALLMICNAPGDSEGGGARALAAAALGPARADALRLTSGLGGATRGYRGVQRAALPEHTSWRASCRALVRPLCSPVPPRSGRFLSPTPTLPSSLSPCSSHREQGGDTPPTAPSPVPRAPKPFHSSALHQR